MTRGRQARNADREFANGNPVRFYARVTFRKVGRLRYLSHLDLARCFDRAIRRARLPVAYTEGFSPRARIAFASALGVGVSGIAELCAVELERRMTGDEFMARLDAQLPGELAVVAVEILTRGKRSPFAAITRARYEIHFAETPGLVELLPQAVAELVTSPEIIFTRETKSRVAPIDIRPGIISLEVAPGSPSGLDAELSVEEATLVKPVEVVTALQSILTGISSEPVALRMSSLTRIALSE